MITNDPNMAKVQIFKELPLPSKVDNKGLLVLIYTGVFIAVKLLLDIRLNLVKISEGKTIKTNHKKFKKNNNDNPVIKKTDKIK